MHNPEIGTFNSAPKLDYDDVRRQMQAAVDSCSSESDLAILREYTAQVEDSPEYVEMLLEVFDDLAAKRRGEIV